MKSRAELKDELDILIHRLEQKYCAPDALGFPSADELDLVRTLIAQLGKAIDIKLFGPTHFWGVAKALDKRYVKLGIKDFFDKLVDKLVSLPQGPLTQMKKRLEAGDPNAKQLEELAKLIEGYDLIRDYTDDDWAALYPVILPFTTDAFRALEKKATDNYSFDAWRLQAFRQFQGWAAFADVQMQHLAWRLKHESTFNETASRVYILQNPEYDEQLRQAFCGDLATLEHIKEAHEKDVVRERKRKQRAAKVG